MMKSLKNLQQHSNSSTHESNIDNTQHSGSNTTLGAKKFTRKREGSSQSAQRSNLVTVGRPAPLNVLDQGLKSCLDCKDGENKLNKIIKSNGYIKCIETPSLKKLADGLQINTETTETETRNERGSGPASKGDILLESQKLFETPNPKVKRDGSKHMHNYRAINSSSKLLSSGKNLESSQKTSYTLINYSQPQTQRQGPTVAKTPDHPEQIKVLENQILILEDENARLKKHVAQLIIEKEQEIKKRKIVELELVDKEHKWKEGRASQVEAAKKAKEGLQLVYLEILRDIECYSQLRSHKGFKAGHQPSVRISKIKQNASQINDKGLVEFFKQQFTHEILNICELLKRYGEIFREVKSNLQKIEIKEKITAKNMSDYQQLKERCKIASQSLAKQKQKSRRLKEDCQNLSKEAQLLRKRQKQSKRQPKLAQRQVPKAQCTEFLNLCLSQDSDDEPSHRRPNRK